MIPLDDEEEEVLPVPIEGEEELEEELKGFDLKKFSVEEEEEEDEEEVIEA